MQNPPESQHPRPNPKAPTSDTTPPSNANDATSLFQQAKARLAAHIESNKQEYIEQQTRRDLLEENFPPQTRWKFIESTTPDQEEIVNTATFSSAGNPEEDGILARMREQREFSQRDEEEVLERKERGGEEGREMERSCVVECSGRCLSSDDAREQQSFGMRRRRAASGEDG
jgi:hypothetical protein